MMRSALVVVYMVGVLACSDHDSAGTDDSDCPIGVQCSSGVCGSTGECVAEDNVVYAAPAGSDTASCTKADPCSITHGFAIAATPRDTIKLEPGSYTASIDVNAASGTTITVDGFDATWNAPAGSHPLALSTGGLRVVGVSFVDQTADQLGSVACRTLTSGERTFALDRVSIDAADMPVRMDNCAASIVRSSIRSHGTSGISPGRPASIDRTLIDGGGGITAATTTVQITNSVIANQIGSALRPTNFLEGGPGHISANFTTIINSIVNDAPVGGSIDISNSIVLNQGSGARADTITGSRCTVRYTTVFPQGTAPSGDHNNVGIDPLLKDPARGDYHLTPASPAVDAAIEAGTPDFDGTERPQGAKSDMGAFELVR